MRKLLPIALALCACGSGPVPGRTVKVDASGLTYQALPVGYDGTDKFTWDPQALQAFLRWDGTALTEGSVLVTFLDANNAIVWKQQIQPGTAPANQPTGQAQQLGAWTVRLDYNGATGTVAFTAVPAH